MLSPEVLEELEVANILQSMSSEIPARALKETLRPRHVADTKGESKYAKLLRDTPYCVIDHIPVYRGYHPGWRNSCARCKIERTSAWRKGWTIVPGKIHVANLCNACGLKFGG